MVIKACRKKNAQKLHYVPMHFVRVVLNFNNVGKDVDNMLNQTWLLSVSFTFTLYVHTLFTKIINGILLCEVNVTFRIQAIKTTFLHNWMYFLVLLVILHVTVLKVTYEYLYNIFNILKYTGICLQRAQICNKTQDLQLNAPTNQLKSY